MSRQGATLALPPFYGVTRRLVVLTVGAFLLAHLLLLVAPNAGDLILDHAALMPGRVLFRELWQLFTYSFLNLGLVSMLLACISLWYVGAMLESERGGRWLGEYFLVSTVGGGLLSAIISRAFLAGSADFGPDQRAYGIWAAVLAMLLAYARSHPDEEIRLYFVIRLKVKYLVAIYLVVYLALTMTGGDRFNAMTALLVALCGYFYLRGAPRRGLRYAASERAYGLRNAWYKSKRKRAAKQFKVYMRKQGKDVNLDSSGKYVPLDEERRDPNDKRWMN